MNRFIKVFMPVSRGCIWIFLSLNIVCLNVRSAGAQEFDPEFWRIVPDVRGLTVDQVKEDKGIKNLEIYQESSSQRPKGTISMQEPNPGARLNIAIPLKVWVSNPAVSSVNPSEPLHFVDPPPTFQPPAQEELHALVWPRECAVMQGEKAVFESRSTPRGGIRETWLGPGNQQGRGSRFEVHTAGLTPGSYVVTLTAMNGRRQRDSAGATLVVMERAVSPQPPDGVGGNGSEGTPIRYKVWISTDTPEVRQSMPVTFTAEVEPGMRAARFRFHFGDSSQVETPALTVSHVYGTTGTFAAFVQVLGRGDEIISESNHIEIKVFPIPVRPESGRHGNNHKWLWIGGALLAGAGAGYLLFSLRKGVTGTGTAPGDNLRVVPKDDMGRQDFDAGLTPGLGPEINFIPIADRGIQEITLLPEPFMREERWGDE